MAMRITIDFDEKSGNLSILYDTGQLSNGDMRPPPPPPPPPPKLTALLKWAGELYANDASARLKKNSAVRYKVKDGKMVSFNFTGKILEESGPIPTALKPGKKK